MAETKFHTHTHQYLSVPLMDKCILGHFLSSFRKITI
jgi:hypothetical protein